MESVAVTTAPHSVYFICSPNDRAQIKECKRSGADVLIVSHGPSRGDFAKKINYAFDQTDEPWIFQGADDIRFSPGWDTQALKMGYRVNASVVGTNDLHNPNVLRGRSSTHTLFRRSYIESYGSGTVDNTGRVFCELYDHQFVDVEFIHTATMRRQWVFAKRSVVEHLHPHWGLGEMDATYAKATRDTEKDLKLHRSRLILIKNHTAEERRARRR